MCAIPQFDEHPLKARLKEHGLALWQIRRLLGRRAPSEGRLSRMLNGVIDFPEELQGRLEGILKQVSDGGHRNSQPE